MSDTIIVAVIAGLPGLLGVIWQIVRTVRTSDQEQRLKDVEAQAKEVGLLEPLHDEIDELRRLLDAERLTRQSENIAWASRCALLEARIVRLERQLRENGLIPQNGGND